MPWEPLPYVEPELPTVRGLFIDVEIVGGLSIGGDIISSNWDGATPVDLSSAADSAATAGFAFDTSAGAIQAMTIYAEGGEIGNLDIVGNLDIQTGGTFRTGTSGARIEITSSDIDRIRFYTDDSFEAISGVIRALTGGTDGTTRTLSVGIWAPTTTGDTNATSIVLRSESEDDSTTPPTITAGYAGGSSQIPEFKLTNSFKLMLEDGTESVPSLTFNTDSDTGTYLLADGAIAWTTAGVRRFSLDVSGILVSVSGSAAAPSIKLNDANTGFYLKSANNIGFSSGGSEWMSSDSTNMFWSNHVIVAASNTYNMGTATVYINDINADNFFNRSDARTKHLIRPVELGSEFIYGLKPRSFEKLDEGEWYGEHTWDGYVHTGFIAQEVRALLIEQGHPVEEVGLYRSPGRAYRDEQFIDFDNNPEQFAPGLHGLSYEQFIAPMVKTIQELNERLEALEGMVPPGRG